MKRRIALKLGSRHVLTALLLTVGIAAGLAARPVTAQPAPYQGAAGVAGRAHTTAQDSPAASTQDAGTVKVQAYDFGYNAPDTVASGTVNFAFQNGGSVYHMMQFLRLDDAVTADDLQAAVQNGSAADALDLGTPAGGANAIDAGDEQDLSLDLQPGNYVMLCYVYSDDGIPHAQKGMVHAFTVTDDQSAASAPAADLTVQAQDYSYNVPAISAGQQTVHFVNNGPQPHELALVKLSPGETPDQAEQAEQAEQAGLNGTADEGTDNDPSGGISVISPGQESWATLNFTPGTYMFICYMRDPASGQTHAALGMSHVFVVPDSAASDQGSSSSAPAP